MKELDTMMGWYQDGMGGGGWALMILAMAAFWTLVVVAVIALFRGSGNNGTARSAAGHRDPMAILEERFARGEIDAEEYNARQAVLRDAVR